MTSPAEIISDLARARAAFQRRTILAVIGHHTGDSPMTDPVPNSRRSPMEHEHSLPSVQDRLSHALATMVNDDDSKAGTEQRQRFIDRTRTVIDARDALDAAQARIAALEAFLRIVADGDRNDFTDNHLIAQHLLEATPVTDPPASDTRG